MTVLYNAPACRRGHASHTSTSPALVAQCQPRWPMLPSESSSSRKVLRLPEILLMIFALIARRHGGGLRLALTFGLRGPNEDLARAARVCRAFSGPALETLWRHIQSFVPLVRLLSCVRRYGNPTAVSWVSLVDLTEHCLSFLWCNLKKSRDLHKLFSLGSNRGRVAFRLDAFQALRCVRARHCPHRLVGPDRCTCGRRRCIRVFPSI